MDESAVFLENFDKATHVSAFELVGEVDGEGDGGDGILGSVSTVADDDGVAESFDADLIDPEVAGIGGGLSVWEGIGMGRGRFQRMKILPQFRVKGKGGEAAKTPRFWMLDFIFLIGEGIAHVPRSWDTRKAPRRGSGMKWEWRWPLACA